MRNSSERFSQVTNTRDTDPGGGGAAAGLGQQASGSLIFIILRLQLHGSQPDLLTVRVGLERRKNSSLAHRNQTVHPQTTRRPSEDREIFLTWKARARMLLAAGTSSASHLDLAPISQRTSALGQ